MLLLVKSEHFEAYWKDRAGNYKNKYCLISLQVTIWQRKSQIMLKDYQVCSHPYTVIYSTEVLMIWTRLFKQSRAQVYPEPFSPRGYRRPSETYTESPIYSDTLIIWGFRALFCLFGKLHLFISPQGTPRTQLWSQKHMPQTKGTAE